METLFNRLRNQELQEGETLVCFLGQAGVLIKSYPQRYVIVDPYLSDLCETRIGIKFKRLMPALLDADELDALQLEAYLLTHHHEDHLDAFLIPALRDKAFPFYAPPESAALLGELGVARDRILTLHDGAEHLLRSDIRIHGVFADHGEYAPDAVGIVIEIGGRTIFHMGDTCLDRAAFAAIRDKFRIDLLFVPINGRYGNMDAADGAEAVAILQPKQAVPCHFWMLPGNSGGDLELFLDQTAELAPQTNVRLMAAGETLQM